MIVQVPVQMNELVRRYEEAYGRKQPHGGKL